MSFSFIVYENTGTNSLARDFFLAIAMLNIMQSYCCYQKQSVHKHTEPFSPSINYVVTLPC